MKIEFYNTPEPKSISTITLPETPVFLSYKPDWELIERCKNKYAVYKNFIVIGHGGSVSSLFGMVGALHESLRKNVVIINTIDPDYLGDVKMSCDPKDSLVIAISKSGQDITELEALMQFVEYPLLVIAGAMSPLAHIGEKLKAEVLINPPIYGRYAAMTEVALLPAAIVGIDSRAVYEGAHEIYPFYEEENDSFRAASMLHQLEEKGIVDVFMPFYDRHLFDLKHLFVQLCHESFGKDGKGQTYFTHEAPESQHHTNQRFFGGPKNIAGWFFSVEQPVHSLRTVVPKELRDVAIKEHFLNMIDQIPLETALQFEAEATMEDAKINGIPLVHQSVVQRTPHEIGRLIAFWQFYAVYGSILRGVNPFDQPQVEASKRISFDKRLKYKKFL